MPKLAFFSRVALLCNICFLITLLLRFAPDLKYGFFISTIVIIGLVLSIVINVLLHIFCLLIIAAGKPIRQYVPAWLLVINFLFFVLQAILLMK
jgi:hypothetical protein